MVHNKLANKRSPLYICTCMYYVITMNFDRINFRDSLWIIQNMILTLCNIHPHLKKWYEFNLNTVKEKRVYIICKDRPFNPCSCFRSKVYNLSTDTATVILTKLYFLVWTVVSDPDPTFQDPFLTLQIEFTVIEFVSLNSLVQNVDK